MSDQEHPSAPDVGPLGGAHVLEAPPSGWIARLGPAVDACEQEISASWGRHFNAERPGQCRASRRTEEDARRTDVYQTHAVTTDYREAHVAHLRGDGIETLDSLPTPGRDSTRPHSLRRVRSVERSPVPWLLLLVAILRPATSTRPLAQEVFPGRGEPDQDMRLPLSVELAELPFVTVIIPCRNEVRFVEAFLDSVLANDYPKDKLEILLIDGMSDDGTRDLVQKYLVKSPQLRVVDNPSTIKPVALNLGIRESRGEIVVRLDVHAEYERSYISKCVRGLLEHPAADNVGGVRRTKPRDNNVIGRAVALSTNHVFGAGNSKYRVGTAKPEWVDTVFGGCYRRSVFIKIGVFDEALTRAQDREFNQRLRNAGGRILLLPDIDCVYYVRSEFREFCSWIFEAGYWPFRASRLTGRWIGSWRNIAPPGFVLATAVGVSLSIVVSSVGQLTSIMLGLYGLATMYFSSRLAWRQRDAGLLFGLPLVFAATHVLYGIGSLWGIIDPLPKRDRQHERAHK